MFVGDLTGIVKPKKSNGLVESVVDPYDDEDTIKLVAKYAKFSSGGFKIPTDLGNIILKKYKKDAINSPAEDGAEGDVQSWTLIDKDNKIIASGYLEHDDDFSKETGKPAWVERGAYVMPKHQRKGVYRHVLKVLSKKLGSAIYPDSAQTEVNQKLWQKHFPEGLAEGLINETYTTGLGAFLKYLNNGLDHYDFAHMLEEFFQAEDIETPEGFDEDAPYDFFETPEFEDMKDDFVVWLERNIHDHDCMMPTYMFLTGASLVPRQTWLVHFSNSAGDIANNGFEFGAEDFTQIGLTTHFSEEKRHSRPGWNFAFRADSRYARTAAANGKYGKHAVLFQSAGVEAEHMGDQESQVVFWGPNVKERFLLTGEGGGSWSVTIGERVLSFDSFQKAVKWVITNHGQYRKQLTNARPIYPTPKKDRESLLAKKPEPYIKSMVESNEPKWGVSGGRFITPKHKKKNPKSYEIYKSIPTNPPQAVQVGESQSLERVAPMSLAEGKKIAAKVKDFALPGSKWWFEYHCNEAHDSGDAPAWYRSHEIVTVIAPVNYDPGFEGTNFKERVEDGNPLVYRARWNDGFEWDVWEDELCKSPRGFCRPDPPIDPSGKTLKPKDAKKFPNVKVFERVVKETEDQERPERKPEVMKPGPNASFREPKPPTLSTPVSKMKITRASYKDVMASGLFNAGDVLKIEKPKWISIDRVIETEHKNRKPEGQAKAWAIANAIEDEHTIPALWVNAKDQSLLDGHHRLEAMRKKGWKLIPVQYLHLRDL